MTKDEYEVALLSANTAAAASESSSDPGSNSESSNDSDGDERGIRTGSNSGRDNGIDEGESNEDDNYSDDDSSEEDDDTGIEKKGDLNHADILVSNRPLESTSKVMYTAAGSTKKAVPLGHIPPPGSRPTSLLAMRSYMLTNRHAEKDAQGPTFRFNSNPKSKSYNLQAKTRPTMENTTVWKQKTSSLKASNTFLNQKSAHYKSGGVDYRKKNVSRNRK